MPTSPSTFHSHLAGASLKPVYLLAGEEHLLLLEAADALRRRARELGYVEREVLDAERDFDWNDLARSSASLSLFGSRRVIDLRLPTGRPGTEGAKAITEFVAAPPPDTVLLITTTSWSRAHETAWVEVVENAGMFVPFWPLKPAEMPGWIGARAAGAGLKLTPDAVECLVERIEGNLLAAAQEIDKLVLLTAADAAPGTRRGAIDAALLESLVADNARFDLFALVDAMLAGDAARVVRIARALEGEGEQVPALIGWIATQLQLLARAAAAVHGGQKPDAALRAERVWQNKLGLYRAALRRGDAVFWQARLSHAALIERIGKGRAGGDAWRELERLLVACADARAAKSLAVAG
jgi:DNA polymerase-3 subunit delta